MDWNEIKEKHPNALYKFESYLRLNNDCAFQETCYAHNCYDCNLTCNCSLYRFFDEQNLKIFLFPDHTNYRLFQFVIINGKSRAYHSTTVLYESSDGDGLNNKRKDAEEAAFMKAFEILEESLNNE